MKQIAHNISPRTKKIEYIVIHDTGNMGKGANAESHYKYFNGGNRGSSADFFVDDTQALQANDYNKYYTWHCGDGNGKYGITNAKSIGIEICVNSDGNYDVAFQNAVQLTKQLMAELGIDINNVVRHYDASRKNCPATMSADNWAAWTKFKAKLREVDVDMEELKELKAEVSALKVEISTLKNKMVYDKMVYDWIDDNMPEWGRPTITKLKQKGILKGDEAGKLNLTDDMLRMMVILDRAGTFDK